MGNEVPETSLAVNRTGRGVGERALKPPPYWEDCERTVMVANRTRESRPSGMKRGAHGNVMHDLMTICHEAGNSGYLGSHRSKHARAVFLSRHCPHCPGENVLLQDLTPQPDPSTVTPQPLLLRLFVFVPLHCFAVLLLDSYVLVLAGDFLSLRRFVFRRLRRSIKP